MSQFTTLRSEVKSWNLGSDDKLIKGIHQFSDKLFQNTQGSLDSFQELKYLLNSCNIEINNTFSQYQKLSERKFTEQKMAPIGDVVHQQEEKKDTQDRISTDAKRIDFFKNALSKGLEAFNIGGNDEQNDDVDERSVSQNSITYSVTSVTSGIMKNQRLPFFIGSKIFMDDKHIGLILKDDDEDEDAPQDGQNIISQDVYDPRTESQLNQSMSQQPADLNQSGIPPAPPMNNMNGIPPAPPIGNLNGVPPAPPINNLIPPAPPIGNMNGVPPPPVNLNLGVPSAPNIVVNNNAPPAPPINLAIPPPPPLNLNNTAPLIPQPNSMPLDNSSAGDDGNMQQQLLRALQNQSNRQNRVPSVAQPPRILTLQEEIQKIGQKKNQDHALLEQEEDSQQIRPTPPPPSNNAASRISVRDALIQSQIGEPMPPAPNSQEQNNSQTKQVNKALPIPSALFSQAGFVQNLLDEDDEEDSKQQVKRNRSTRFTFNNLFNIEKPMLDEEDEMVLDKNKKSSASSMIQQPNEGGKRVQFMEPNQQNSQINLPPPPIAPPVQIPIQKQEVPQKRLQKLFESSDEDSKDPFAKAQKIGQQYRQEEKQAKIQAITRPSTTNNAKKKIFDDSDSDVENFQSKTTPQPPAQVNPPQRQTTTKAKIFNSDSEDDVKKPNQQMPPAPPVVNNPLAVSNNSKPQTDLKPAIKNPLGGLGFRVSSKKRGIMDDSSQNSNSEDDSAAQNQKTQAAEKQRLEAAEKQRQEQERIQREEEQAKLQQEALKRQQEKEEEERKHQQQQEEQMRQLKLKQQEEERNLKEKMEEEQRKKQQEEEDKKKQAAAQQPTSVIGLGRAAQKKKKNKFGSSSENEDSDEDDHNSKPTNKNPAPPVIQQTSSVLSQNQQQPAEPAPVSNPMEDALRSQSTQSQVSDIPTNKTQSSISNRISQALKDKIEGMGNFDPTKMLKGMTVIPKKPEQEHKADDNQQQSSEQQAADKSLLISTQMDRVSIPSKKKKPRTIQKFVDNNNLQPQIKESLVNSIIMPDDDDHSEKPLAVQKRNIEIKEKASIQPPTSNLPNISSKPKKGFDLGSDDDSGPLMQKKTQPLSRPSNTPAQTQPKPKGLLDLGASDDDDKPLMNKKPQVPPAQVQNPLPPLPADETILPIQHNPPANLTASQKNDDNADSNKLLKGLPNILGAPKQENKKPQKLKFGDSDDDNDKPLALTQKRQVQSVVPQPTQQPLKQNKEDDDLGIKPIARNSENPSNLQGGTGLPNILSNPLSNQPAPSRPSGLPNISGNPLGKSNLANKDKKDQKKKKVMFSDDEEEEQQQNIRPSLPQISQKPTLGLSNDATESLSRSTNLSSKPAKKNLFGDDSDDDQISNNNANATVSRPPERPSANLSGKPKGRNLFDDSDEDDKKQDAPIAVSNPLSQSTNLNSAPQKPQLPQISRPSTQNRNLFNDDSDDEAQKNASKNPLGQSKQVSNPLGGQSRPSQNPLGGGSKPAAQKPRKSLFDDDSD